MDERTAERKRAWRANPADRDAFSAWLRSERRIVPNLFRVRIDESGLFEYRGVNVQGRPEFEHLESGIVMVEIPAGELTFPKDTAHIDFGHKWYNPIQAARPFLLGKFPVTQEQWYRVFGTTPWPDRVKNGSVTNISWADSTLFCSNMKLFLPTEAMWLYALGNYDPPSHATAAQAPLSPVGRGNPFPHGLGDMVGNVTEWLRGIRQCEQSSTEIFGSNGLEDVRDIEELIFERHLSVEWDTEQEIEYEPDPERLVKYGLSVPLEAGTGPVYADTGGPVVVEPDVIPNAGIDGIEEISPGDILDDMTQGLIGDLQEVVAGLANVRVFKAIIGGSFRTGSGRGRAMMFGIPADPKRKGPRTGFRAAWA